MIERVHTFGPKGTLVGVVTLPDPPKKKEGAGEQDDDDDKPIIVLLNAGLMHRAGPFRLSVHLARQTAAQGFKVLRFDQSGLGDSAPNPERVKGQIILDAQAAMAFLTETYGAKKFVFGGLCSGAVNAHRISLADDRVIGMWMLDGYAYPTRTYYRHMVRRWLKKRQEATNGNVLALVRRVARDLAEQVRMRALGRRPADSPEPGSSVVAKGNPAAASDDGADDLIFFQDDWPDIQTVRTELEKIVDRGVNVLFVYTGGWSNFVDERQFGEMFPKLRRRVMVKYYPDADHTYVALSDRQRMLRDVGDFIDTTVRSHSDRSS